MRGGDLIREARKRAGLSQQDLAERLGTSQSVIARWELGRTSPSFERVAEAIRACGFELSVRITNPDPEHALLVEENLRLSPKQRLDRMTSSRSALQDLAGKVQRKGDRPVGARSAAEEVEEKLRLRQGHGL